MSYKQEFAAHWRQLLAAAIGLSVGLSFSQYVTSLFAPGMIAEFGWTKAQFALIGTTPFVSMFFIPLAGRFVDRAGPATAAGIGFIALPLGYLALSFMTGSFMVYLAITLAKSIFGILTTSLVFTRVAVERFESARGFALSVLMSGPPIVAALFVPLIGAIIGEYGWRVGFRALALLAAVGGVVSVTLLRRKAPGAGPDSASASASASARERFTFAEVRELFRTRVLLLIVAGMFLVNVPQGLASTQLKLVLQDNRAPDHLATWIVSLYAIGVAVGRFACGLALDRFAAHKVALFSLGLPALGLAALASPFDAALVLAGAVLILGCAQGAEGDLAAYIISRNFPLRNYSLVLGIVMMALTLGVASGSLLLSYTLHQTQSYATFLWICAVATVMGALAFYLSGLRRPDTVLRPAGPATS